MMDMMTGSVGAVTLGPGNLEDPVSNGVVGVHRQLLEGLGDVKARIVVDEADHRGVEHVTSELPGLIGEGSVPVFVICL